MRELLANKKVRYVLIGFGLFVIVTLSIIANTPSTNSNKKAAEPVLKDGPATINNGTELYKIVGDFQRYLLLRKDLTTVARKVYGDKSVSVLFTVSSVENKTDTYTVDGYFGKDKKSSLSLSLKSLPNSRLQVTAKDNKGTDVSDLFKSNSSRNKVIASMPKNTPAYDLDYVVEGDFFTITVHSVDDSALTAAKTDLKNLLGTDYDEKNISIIYPSYLSGEPQYQSQQNEDLDGIPND
jgi:hypothetical protein